MSHSTTHKEIIWLWNTLNGHFQIVDTKAGYHSYNIGLVYVKVASYPGPWWLPTESLGTRLL